MGPRPSGSDCPATIASNSYSIKSATLTRLNQIVYPLETALLLCLAPPAGQTVNLH